jgi:predicted RNase H-like HicB family nuclease
MSKHITVAIWQENDWFIAKCIENNVASQGHTMDEVLDNLKEAVSLYYEGESETALQFPRAFLTTMEIAL